MAAVERGEKEVGLWRVNPSEAEVASIARAVGESRKVKWLYLQSNRITDTDASALAEAVAKSTSLTTLYLGLNQITNVGATKLSAALVRSAKVQRIDLGGNQTTPTGDEALKAAHAAIKAIRPTVWLLSRPLPAFAGKLTAPRFILERDGDHAIWYRVMEFLAEAKNARERSVNRVRWL